MLSDEERQEIEEELRLFPYKQAAGIEALKAIQRHRGWVSDEGIQDLAEFLGMSPEELDNIATFYNLIFRKPVGKHVIHICDSISCWIMGYEGVRDRLRERLNIRMGETTGDGQFTLLPIQCLGTCDHAPALMIDDDLYRDLTPEQIDEILTKYRENG
jgi:NADH-quinone oxidoreductase subunit E